MSRRIAFYANKNASHKASKKKAIAKINEKLKNTLLDYEIFETASVSQLKEVFSKNLENNILEHVAVGGDGSLHLLVHLSASQDIIESSKLTLGLLPFGTGNDWIRNFSSQTLDDILDFITENKTSSLDIGKIEFHNKPLQYFVNMGGIGLGGHVIQLRKNMLWLKQASYYIATLISLFRYKPVKIDVQIGEVTFKNKLFQMSFGIGKYAGGDMKLCPDAIMTDGLFDINIIKPMPKRKLIWNIFRLQNGHYLNHLDVQSIRHSEIIFHNTYSIDMEVDGEYINGEVSKIICLKEYLTFFV